MRKLIYVLGLFAFVAGNAQTLKGGFDLTNYPEVSFIWNEYNPEPKNASQFILMSDEKKIPFVFQHLPSPRISGKGKTILFLWEDLNHRQHAGQSDFTRNVLYNFLKNKTLHEGSRDRFNVAVFDRKGGNDFGTSIHTLLSDAFTADPENLAEAVRNFIPQYDSYSNQEHSELNIAIEEGLDLLEKEPFDRVRAIVVFTAGSNYGSNKFNKARALSLKIPVYVVKYPMKGCEYCNYIDMICKDTHGLEVVSNDMNATLPLLELYYLNMTDRHYGQDYRITFSSLYPRDWEWRDLVLSVSGKKHHVAFTATSAFPLPVQAKESNTRAILIGLSLLLCVALIAFIIYRAIRRWVALENKQQETQWETDLNRQALDDARRRKEEEKRLNEEKERYQHLLKQMQTKHLFPRLQYSMEGVNKSYTVHKPEISIGRDNDNDLVLPFDSVSRHHAKVVFNGSCFEIKDLESTNKVVVNGAFEKRATLANGDVIGLGETVLYFYV